MKDALFSNNQTRMFNLEKNTKLTNDKSSKQRSEFIIKFILLNICEWSDNNLAMSGRIHGPNNNSYDKS